MDCSWGEGNNACDGGEDFRAYQWIMKHGGLSTEEQYGAYLAVVSVCVRGVCVWGECVWCVRGVCVAYQWIMKHGGLSTEEEYGAYLAVVSVCVCVCVCGRGMC